MGYIQVVACDLESHILFKRMMEVQMARSAINYKNVISNGAKNYEKFNFSNWFYNI